MKRYFLLTDTKIFRLTIAVGGFHFLAIERRIGAGDFRVERNLSVIHYTWADILQNIAGAILNMLEIKYL